MHEARLAHPWFARASRDDQLTQLLENQLLAQQEQINDQRTQLAALEREAFTKGYAQGERAGLGRVEQAPFITHQAHGRLLAPWGGSVTGIGPVDSGYADVGSAFKGITCAQDVETRGNTTSCACTPQGVVRVQP